MSKARRSYTAAYKLEAILEGIRGEKSVAQICRERGIKDTLYYKWRDQFMSQAKAIFEDKRGGNNLSADNASAARIAELERMVGRLTMENDILKKAGSLLDNSWRRNGQ